MSDYQVAAAGCTIWVTMVKGDQCERFTATTETTLKVTTELKFNGWQFGRMDHATSCDCFAACAACGTPINICEGHSDDVELTWRLTEHDDGRHEHCHSKSPCRLGI